MDSDRRMLLQPRPTNNQYITVVYAALTAKTTDRQQVEEFIERLAVIAEDRTPHLADVRHNLLVATLQAMEHSRHGFMLRQFFESPRGQRLLAQYGLEDTFDGLWLEDALYNAGLKRRWKPRSAGRWIKRNLTPAPQAPEDRLYNAMTIVGRKKRFSAPFTGRSVVENAIPALALVQSIARSDPAYQTTANRSFYQDTIMHVLMRDPKAEGMTTAEYQQRVVRPLLDAIYRIATHVDDNRFDIRYNLLLTAWLARNGPHMEVLHEYRKRFKHLHEVHGVYGRALLNPDEGFLVLPSTWPRRLSSERRALTGLFKRWLRNSTNSADGQIVYSVNGWRTVEWRQPAADDDVLWTSGSTATRIASPVPSVDATGTS